MQNKLIYNQISCGYSYLHSKDISDKLELFNKYKLKRKMLGIKDEFSLIADEDNVIELWGYKGNGSKKVVVPEFVSCIKKNAFVISYDIEELIICDGVYRVELDSFHGCKYLKVIDLPNSLMDIHMCEFIDHKNLQEIKVHSKKVYDYFIDEVQYEGKVKLIDIGE